MAPVVGEAQTSEGRAMIESCRRRRRRVKDLVAAIQIDRSIELIIRSHARLLGDEWAILMHVEALNGDMTTLLERSRDLRWMNAQDNPGAADINGGAPDDV